MEITNIRSKILLATAIKEICGKEMREKVVKLENRLHRESDDVEMAVNLIEITSGSIG